MKRQNITSLFFLTLIVVQYSCNEDIVTSKDENSREYYKGMVRIPSKDAEFIMGSNNGKSDEQPEHSVTFTYDFYLDTVEVTQKQFREVFEESDTFFVSGHGITLPPWSEDENNENYPAYYIDWDLAVLYCNALTKLEGRTDTVYSYSRIFQVQGFYVQLFDVEIDHSKMGYRLPTEAEWEYACRAGSANDYLADLNDIYEYGWYNLESNLKIQPVAMKKPNSFGLYDIVGNLWEWCQDYYNSTHYFSSDSIDPKGPPEGRFRVVRGGGIKSDISDLRFARRKYYLPFDAEGYSDGMGSWDPLGFRVCLPISGSSRNTFGKTPVKQIKDY